MRAIRWAARFARRSCAAGPMAWSSWLRPPACPVSPADERDPLAASTFGTGLVLATAIGLGVRNIVLGLGGSATTDGGAGVLSALGVRFLDDEGIDLDEGGGGSLGRLARVDLT